MEMLSHDERRAVERLDQAAMLARTEQWAAVNSGTRNTAGCAAMAGLLADAFAALPGEVTLVEPGRAEAVGADGRVDPIAHGRHLYVRVRPDAPVRMLLTGHMDTVYPADHPFQTLAWREPGVLNGPGVADMKGGVSLMLEALLAVEAVAPTIGYDVVINSDEETGSFSSAALLAQAARGKVAALTYEPALPDGTLAGARGGTGNFSIVVRGRAAHAGRNPQDGRNAIVAASAIAVALHGARSPRLAVNPARIDGGGPNNVVPDLAVLRVNFRPADRDEIDRAAALIEGTVAQARADHDVVIEVHGGFNRPPKPIDAGAARLFDLVAQAGLALGQTITWRDTGGVCDGNNIAACGVPVVDTMGARGGAIHSMEEFLIVDSLTERAALSAVTMLRIAAGAMA
ncbi:hydrolase [Sphingomonas ginsenosidimutans]|jgi:glutamate carboxypeptidase|uniref:hydrolase n=2 Tax=Sphingomonas TaxID=13687 RepID=UPI000877A776|nr:hydrolase [Sphingomonas ginsenosidimutans]MBY0303180.1 hydrolase [Sphingomonas ginsenosidimutans]